MNLNEINNDFDENDLKKAIENEFVLYQVIWI